GRQRPDAHGRILAARDDGMAVGGEHGMPDAPRMRQHGDRLPGRGVPKARGAVEAGGEQAPGIGTEGHGPNGAVVLRQEPKGLAGADVPDPSSTIEAAGRHEPPVGAERLVAYAMYEGRSDRVPVGRVPDPHLVAIRGAADAGSQDETSIRAERGALDHPLVVDQGRDRPASRHFPDPYLAQSHGIASGYH